MRARHCIATAVAFCLSSNNSQPRVDVKWRSVTDVNEGDLLPGAGWLAVNRIHRRFAHCGNCVACRLRTGVPMMDSADSQGNGQVQLRRGKLYADVS